MRLARALKPPLLSPVVMMQEAAHDDSTVAFLLTQSLRQRQEEVEDAAVGREEDVEEDDQPEERFSCHCEFLEMRENRWKSRGHGVAKLLLCPSGVEFFQFWRGDRCLADDVIQGVGCDGLVLRPGRGGRTWVWSNPECAGGPGEYLHAVRFASQELARRFYDEWMG